VLLNAAAALAAQSGDFQSALGESREVLESGAALAKMNALVGFSQSFIQPVVE
jgi:anthranilate phosphoribosyltransferase